ncbi:MAG: AraC family transcriptional regulator [Prevotella sp.]|nr:AraC family transcriptional regulator [Prevotella sp.]
MNKEPLLTEVDIDNFSENPIVDYADGDIAIIDNVKDLHEISPYYARLNFIILCQKGRIRFDINGKTLMLRQGEILLSAPNVILDNYLFSPDFECKILCLSDKIVQKLLNQMVIKWNTTVYVRRTNIIRMPEEDIEQFKYYYDLVRYKIAHSERPYQKEIIQSVIRALLLDVCSIADSSEAQAGMEKLSQGKILFNNFLHLLSNNKVKRQPVGRYAYELSVSPKYLSIVCEKYSGKTASQWIDQYVLEDVRYYLKNTSLSIKEIADKLGFATMSHFGTYVRKHYGMSPTVYRDESRKPLTE